MAGATENGFGPTLPGKWASDQLADFLVCSLGCGASLMVGLNNHFGGEV
jgi:hypothetical protein